MQHVERGLSLGMAIGLGQVALDDQAVAVLQQGMPHAAEHCAGARRFLVCRAWPRNPRAPHSQFQIVSTLSRKTCGYSR